MAAVEKTDEVQYEELKMNKFAKVTVVSAIVAAVGLSAVGVSAGWDQRHGHCDRGLQGGPATMMKHRGKHGRFADRDLDLTADEARILVEARLIMRGNDRLKVGQVAQKDDDTFLVDVVTVDDSLVRRIEIDRDNGFPRGRGPAGPEK
jgi:hypothetical protein